MTTTGPRLVPAHVAHSVSAAQPCGERLLFPGDEVEAVCRLLVGDHQTKSEWHTDSSGTRRWRRVGRGDYEGMKLPGSAPLRAVRDESEVTA